MYTFNASKQEDVRLNKGVRYVQFLHDYFDADKNKVLYKALKNPRMVSESKKKYDSDKVEYHEKSGYLELQHLRAQREGNLANYIQILCVRAYKGERSPATVCALLEGEWEYVSKYLKFVQQHYKLNEVGLLGGVEKKRVETTRRDVMQVMDVFEKEKKKADGKNGQKENQDSSGVNDVNEASPSKKRKANDKKRESAKTAKPIEKKNKAESVDGRDSDKENEAPNDNDECCDEENEDEVVENTQMGDSRAVENDNQHKNNDSSDDSDSVE